MNSTRALLATTDSQLKHCPPRLHESGSIEAHTTRLHVMHRFAPLLVAGEPQTFSAWCCWHGWHSVCWSCS